MKDDPNLTEIQRLDAEVARLRSVILAVRKDLEAAAMVDNATVLAFTVGVCMRKLDDATGPL
jgi:hypothetical protein